ncbi:MAG: hypothetical protein K9K79_09490 [Desulfohalobiaceae bacterium]|nr:hypothetical protein [Desulfohalobiaceae bacterium]
MTHYCLYAICLFQMGVMHMKNNKLKKLKTLGPQAAYLVAALHEEGKTVFSHADVMKVTGLNPKSARNFVASLVNRGVAARLKPGLFILVPYELGFENEYMGNPFVIARELANSDKYYISHSSAMDIHQMVTQPQLKIYTSVTRPIRPRFILGSEFFFVFCKLEHFFGVENHWVTKTEKVRVSDLERTVIDGIKLPEHCGGISEVAKGLWIRRDDLSVDRLIDYAFRLNIGAVIRRLGFLLETFGLGSDAHISRLQERLTRSYALLDPVLPDEGGYSSRWRLRLNIEAQELLSLIRT